MPGLKSYQATLGLDKLSTRWADSGLKMDLADMGPKFFEVRLLVSQPKTIACIELANGCLEMDADILIKLGFRHD